MLKKAVLLFFIAFTLNACVSKKVYQELETKFNLFLSKLDKYSPREYILNTLTMEHCEQKLINLVESLSN